MALGPFTTRASKMRMREWREGCDGPAPVWMHSALLASQSSSFLAHGSTSTSHTAPDHDLLHVHVYASVASVQTPPFLHGDDAQSFTSTWQLNPLKASLHTHVYANTCVAKTKIG